MGTTIPTQSGTVEQHLQAAEQALQDEDINRASIQVMAAHVRYRREQEWNESVSIPATLNDLRALRALAQSIGIQTSMPANANKGQVHAEMAFLMPIAFQMLAAERQRLEAQRHALPVLVGRR